MTRTGTKHVRAAKRQRRIEAAMGALDSARYAVSLSESEVRLLAGLVVDRLDELAREDRNRQKRRIELAREAERRHLEGC